MPKKTKTEKLSDLAQARATFEKTITDPTNPLHEDFIFRSIYDSYCKCIEGADEAYKELQRSGRYIDTGTGPKSNPANGDFIKYMQQANNLARNLTDMLKKSASSAEGVIDL